MVESSRFLITISHKVDMIPSVDKKIKVTISMEKSTDTYGNGSNDPKSNYIYIIRSGHE